MVKIISAVGCVLSGLAMGVMLRLAPNDTHVWLCAFMMGCAFMCFWAELNRPD